MISMEINAENHNGLSSFIIRIIAIAAMIWSFLSSSKIPQLHNSAMADSMFWLSYTLFAFLLSEGVYHTTNRLLYLRRFIFFTVISEFAYDLYKYGRFWNIKGQSIMLTLLLCLVTMLFCDYLNRKFYNVIINIIAVVGLSIAIINLGAFLHCEFNVYGVIIAMVFYASKNMDYPRVFQIACLLYMTFKIANGSIISLVVNGITYSVPITIFTFFALILTWFYNENRGPNSMLMKITYYLTYPVLLLIFYMIKFYL